MIVPAFGVISQIVSTYSKKPVFGEISMVYAMASIAFLGFLVWSYYMMASSFSDKWCLNFAVCWNSLTLINTFLPFFIIFKLIKGNSKNFINYTWSAGNQFNLHIFKYLLLWDPQRLYAKYLIL